MTYSRDERRALCDLLDETGPAAPTLCVGWSTADLAAHLVLRERRPDAAAGIVIGPLARYTAHVQAKLARSTPFPQLVQTIRNGPPRLSPMAVPAVDDRVNLAEFFVHHEDVRRAAPHWQPRELPDGMTEALWERLPMSRLLLRRVPVGVEFARDDADDNGSGPLRITIKNGTPVVTVVGSPAELTLWALGRTSVAQVRLEGAEGPVRQLTSASWRM